MSRQPRTASLFDPSREFPVAFPEKGNAASVAADGIPLSRPARLKPRLILLFQKQNQCCQESLV
jgi:hypothetical protein